jgi:Helicase conserved C-terminal domain
VPAFFDDGSPFHPDSTFPYSDDALAAAEWRLRQGGEVQRGDIQLVCATDAACEGLNLQRLGAQVNTDLPWNLSRLEQRKGRPAYRTGAR